VVNSVSDPTLTIAGVGTPLTLVTGPLPAGEVAEYQFTFDGNTGTFIIFQDGSLNLDTGSTDLFSTLEVGQAAVFSFNYTDIDGDGLVSNAAPVTVTINGDNLPVANPDSVILSEPQVTGDQVFLMNILDNDNDGAGTRPLSVHDIVSGSPELTIAGTSFTLTPVTSSDPSVVAEYTFTFNGQTSDLTIAQNGDVTILPNGGQEIFVSLLQGEKVDFSFQYHNTDGVDVSNVATATVEIDGEHNPPVPEPNFNIFYEPQVDASIASPGGFVVGNIITDLRFPSLPFDPVTNPVDTDPQGSPLSVNTVTTSTLAINGVDVPLAALTTLVHPTDVAEYQFSFGGNSAMLSIAQSGEVTLSSTDPTFFSFVNEQEEATIFNFNYDVIDQDGITSGSNIAHVSFTINGASDFASGDTLIIPETQVLGSSVTFINIINDDTSSLGLPLTMEDLSNPALMINSVSYNLTSVTPTDSSIFAEFSFSYNGHDSIFTIGKSGDVTLLPFGGQEIFEGLQDGQTADFTFSYRNTDGVATSPADNPGLVHIEITGDSPFANPNTYTLDVNGMEDNEQLGTDGNYHSVIGNILVDPEDPTLSFNPITNPVDTDSNNATPLELSVNTVANVSLTIDGTPETLTAVTGTLPAGEVAEYQFTFGTETDTFAISQDGTVSFVSASANFLQTLAQGESIVFDFDYTNINAADKPSSNSAHVDFTVHGDDDPPIAQPNNYTTDADTISPLLSGGYSVGNIRDDAGPLTDSDPEGDAFSVNSVINPILTIAGDPVTLTTGSGGVASYTFDYNGNTGTFTINADGSVILSAPSGGLFLEGLPVGQNLVFSFDYTDKDTGNLVSNAAHVDFTVAGDALPPIADPDIVFLSETDIVGNQVNLLNILGNDSSPSGHPLSVDHILVGDPNAADPSLSINNTSYVLTSVVSSDPGIVAEYSFDYNGQTSDLLISKNGDVSLLPFNGESIFQPLNDSQVAIFIFSYTNTDGVLPSSPTDVGIFINGITQPPQANPDENTVEEDTILSATGNVLTNDLFASSVGNPETAVGTYGTFVLNTDGSYTYTLDNDSPLVQALQQGETVDDQITYIAKNDEGATALSTLTIHVLGINDPPIAEPNTYTDTARNVGAMIADPNFEGLYYVGNIIVDSNPVNGLIDRDPENDGLSVQAVLNPSLTIAMNSVVLTSVVPPFPNSQLALYDFTFQGNTGTFEIDNNGDVYLLAVSPDIFLGLAQGQDVVFSFDYTDRDTGSLISNIAHVDFTIHGDNDPPVAVNDAYQTDENTALVITTPGILFNDSDPDNDTLSAVINTMPAHGTLSLNPDGSFTYTPNLNFSGNDSFTYHNNDGSLDSNVATVNITVNPDNLPPVAEPNTYTVLSGEVNIAISSGGYSVGNIINDPSPIHAVDTDPESTLLTINSIFNATLTIGENPPFNLIAVPPAAGYIVAYSFELDGNTGTFEISANGDVVLTASSGSLFAELDQGEKVILNLDYNVKDALLLVSNTAHVDVSIVNDYPPSIEFVHDADTVDIVAQKVIAGSSTPYSQFNIFTFPLIEEGINISDIVKDSPNPLTNNINDFLINNITLEANEPNLSITFINEGAGYKNTLGWYKINTTTGEISAVNIIWDNTSATGSGGNLTPGVSTQILGNLTAGEKIGFFLVADGFRQNLSGNETNWDNLLSDINGGHAHLAFTTGTSSSSGATINDTSPHLWYIPTDGSAHFSTFEIKSITGSQTGIYHTAADPVNFSLDGDGLQHALGSLIASGPGTAALQMGFEDLYGPAKSDGGSSDRDFNDVLFTVNLHINSTNSEQATSSHLNLYFTDPDGTQLTDAIIDISAGGVSGDNLVLENFAVSSTADPQGFHAITTPGYTALSIKGLGTDLTSGSNQLEIKGLDTHAHYQDIVDNLHLHNNLFFTDPDHAFGTRTFSLQAFDEDGQASATVSAPFIVTQMTAENVFTGTSGNDYLHLTDSSLTNHTYNAGDGDDIIKDGNGPSTINGGAGHDLLLGQGGNDILNAGDGNDTLYGGAGSDTLFGGTGNDFLSGGLSGDTLFGGTGEDVFYFDPSESGSFMDTISDFGKVGSTNPDIIDVSQYLKAAGYVPGLNLIDSFVHIKEVSGVTTLSIDPDGAGPNPFASLATLQGIHTNDLVAVFDGNYHLIVAVG
jgi:VCBS repeat-containing protein